MEYTPKPVSHSNMSCRFLRIAHVLQIIFWYRVTDQTLISPTVSQNQIWIDIKCIMKQIWWLYVSPQNALLTLFQVYTCICVKIKPCKFWFSWLIRLQVHPRPSSELAHGSLLSSLMVRACTGSSSEKLSQSSETSIDIKDSKFVDHLFFNDLFPGNTKLQTLVL